MATRIPDASYAVRITIDVCGDILDSVFFGGAEFGPGGHFRVLEDPRPFFAVVEDGERIEVR